MIPGLLLNTINKSVKPGRVWLLLGARRVGKTVLVKEFIKRSASHWLEAHGEDAAIADLLESRSAERIRQVASANRHPPPSYSRKPGAW